jgi:hypothetical protein
LKGKYTFNTRKPSRLLIKTATWLVLCSLNRLISSIKM